MITQAHAHADERPILRIRIHSTTSDRSVLDVTRSSLVNITDSTLRDVPTITHHFLQSRRSDSLSRAPHPPACLSSFSDCYSSFLVFDPFVSVTNLYPPPPVSSPSLFPLRRHQDHLFRTRFYSCSCMARSLCLPAPPRFHPFVISSISDYRPSTHESNSTSCSFYLTCTLWYRVL